MNIQLQLYWTALVLIALQTLAALPWLLSLILEPSTARGAALALKQPLRGIDALRPTYVVVKLLMGRVSGLAVFAVDVLGSEFVRKNVFILLGCLIAGSVALAYPFALFLSWIRDTDSLLWWGRFYAAVLVLQLLADFFLVVLWVLLIVWPKGAAVALAAFREGLRAPMFWLLLGVGMILLLISIFVPYWTFGEDMLMMKELGFDTIMLMTLLFGILSASISISEEIEGRTAITLMSKPISRRQFLLGKYVGIFLSGLLMIGLLGWWFNWMVLLKPLFETQQQEAVADPEFVTSAVAHFVRTGSVAGDFLRGGFFWLHDCAELLPGLVLGSCQLMIMLALAVALATRLGMIINLVVCLAIFILGQLSPVLTEVAQNRVKLSPSATGLQLLSFVSKLVDSILPSTRYFQAGPALVSDVPPTMPQYYGYVGLAMVYALLYSSILLLVGLLSFEDRDLA